MATGRRASYRLYYWPGIQGRGEFIRLALEDAGAPYEDVARGPGGMREMLQILDGKKPVGRGLQPFAPPFVRSGKLLVAQTANILQYLGPRLGLAPASDAGRLAVHQLQLTIMDLVDEAHDTHHPIASGLYYEDQKKEAKENAEHFVRERIPKFLGWFERELARNSRGRRGWLCGRAASYADLSLFQLVCALEYAFPNAMKRLGRRIPGVLDLRERVARRPGIAAYLSSERRIPFNESGIFRHYPELDP